LLRALPSTDRLATGLHATLYYRSVLVGQLSWNEKTFGRYPILETGGSAVSEEALSPQITEWLGISEFLGDYRAPESQVKVEVLVTSTQRTGYQVLHKQRNVKRSNCMTMITAAAASWWQRANQSNCRKQVAWNAI
jgi:hypothetical protein